MTDGQRVKPPAPARLLPLPRKIVLPERASSNPANERFTFFWGGPLSQWAYSRFEVDNVVYTQAEQYMMAEKARLFRDMDALRRIMKATSPREQQAIGREVTGFDEEVWRAEAKPIVKRGNRAKFTQNPPMLEVLLAAEGTTLVEASPKDRLWGIGVSAKDPRAHSRSTWLGLNWLGEVLTELNVELAPLYRPPSP